MLMNHVQTRNRLCATVQGFEPLLSALRGKGRGREMPFDRILLQKGRHYRRQSRLTHLPLSNLYNLPGMSSFHRQEKIKARSL